MIMLTNNRSTFKSVRKLRESFSQAFPCTAWAHLKNRPAAVAEKVLFQPVEVFSLFRFQSSLFRPANVKYVTLNTQWKWIEM